MKKRNRDGMVKAAAAYILLLAAVAAMAASAVFTGAFDGASREARAEEAGTQQVYRASHQASQAPPGSDEAAGGLRERAGEEG